jgi:hypothetical protein
MVQDTVPYLINMVKDSDDDVRQTSVTTLGQLVQHGQ